MLSFDVFISHSSATKDLARHLYYNFLANSLFPWYDESNLELGDRLTSEIGKGIDNSKGFLLLHSRPAMQKKWVPMEMELARRRWEEDPTFRIISVKLDEEPFHDPFWDQFLFSHWNGTDIAGSLLAVISAFLGRPVFEAIAATATMNSIPIFLNESNTIAEHSRNFLVYYLSHVKNLINGIVASSPDFELRDSLHKINELSVFGLVPSQHGGLFQIDKGKYESIHANRMRIPPHVDFPGLPDQYTVEIVSNTEISTVFTIKNKVDGTPVSNPVPLRIEYNVDLYNKSSPRL